MDCERTHIYDALRAAIVSEGLTTNSIGIFSISEGKSSNNKSSNELPFN